jgi:hypothetical protein
MADNKLIRIEKQIAGIKKELMEIGEMRPGSLSQQYKNPKDKTGAFYQLSYTYKMKSKTEYVRFHQVDRFVGSLVWLFDSIFSKGCLYR